MNVSMDSYNTDTFCNGGRLPNCSGHSEVLLKCLIGWQHLGSLLEGTYSQITPVSAQGKREFTWETKGDRTSARPRPQWGQERVCMDGVWVAIEKLLVRSVETRPTFVRI